MRQVLNHSNTQFDVLGQVKVGTIFLVIVYCFIGSVHICIIIQCPILSSRIYTVNVTWVFLDIPDLNRH